MFPRKLLLLAFLNGVNAQTLRMLQGQRNRQRTLLSCRLLIKVTRFENDGESHDLECAMEDGTGRILPLENAPQFVQDKFENGEILSAGDVLTSSNARIANGKFEIMPGSQVAIDRRPDHVFGGRQGRRLAVTGTKSTLILRVDAPDADTTATLSELSDSVFGTSGDPVNLRSQYKACSFNKLDFAPVNGVSSNGTPVSDGAYEVSISQTVSGVDNGIVRDAVTAAGNTALGNMQSQYDHVIQCIPPGTNSGWIAYAYINWYLSVYNDNWCTFVSGQMHEIGHNLGLAHSGEGSQQYADQSGMMGYSYGSDDGPLMCFNGVKNWQLEWFTDRHVLINAPFNWSGDLYGIADYGSTSISDKMIVRLASSSGTEDIYVSYNKKAGINAGTVEGGNQVMVHTKVNGPTQFGQSWLLAKLNAGESYTATVDGQSVPISVGNIDTVNGVASVSIGVPSTPSPTQNPTKVPTNSPTKFPTKSPTKFPTHNPTKLPTDSPTESPTQAPTPLPTDAPTKNPTQNPTQSPTEFPTDSPTKSPLDQTEAPTAKPTDSPTYIPTNSPTKSPLPLTDAPTPNPSRIPTKFPTKSPTESPTVSPTKSPLDQTDAPTPNSTDSPTYIPTNSPTKSPLPLTDAPTLSHTEVPTDFPTKAPTHKPTPAITNFPTNIPTVTITKSPTEYPTTYITDVPTPSTIICSSITGGGECKKQPGCVWEKGVCVNGGSPPSPPQACSSYSNGGLCKQARCKWNKGVCVDF